jgi:hypothetical protein
MSKHLNIKERIILEISVPKTKPDPNWKGWDLETFELREHLANLINAYGIGILKEELNECEWLLNKLNQTNNE